MYFVLIYLVVYVYTIYLLIIQCKWELKFCFELYGCKRKPKYTPLDCILNILYRYHKIYIAIVTLYKHWKILLILCVRYEIELI